MLEAYRKHVAERAELGIVPLPLSEQQVVDLVELLKNPPAGEDEFLMNLLENRIPAGVDQAAAEIRVEARIALILRDQRVHDGLALGVVLCEGA